MRNKFIIFILSIVILLQIFSIFNIKNNEKKQINTINVVSDIQEKNEELVLYNGTIEHFFTHNLIAYPQIAFQKSNYYGKNLDIDCITPLEFTRFLEQVYNNNYVLCNIKEIFSINNGQAVKNKFYFPKGKKALVLSFDDITYDEKYRNMGTVDKIIVDSKGEIASYTKKINKISYNNEFLPILENFIKLHPDFSFHKARGILCLTGYNGILGYRTQSGSKNRDKEVESAKKLVKTLKNRGWKFACHSYCHGHLKKESDEKLEYDIKKWKEEVACIVGETNLYAYPYGEWQIQKNQENNKQKILLKNGYSLFFGVGSNPFFNTISMDSKSKTLLMDRAPIDGYSLRNRQLVYERIIDCSKIYDYNNRN